MSHNLHFFMQSRSARRRHNCTSLCHNEIRPHLEIKSEIIQLHCFIDKQHCWECWDQHCPLMSSEFGWGSHHASPLSEKRTFRRRQSVATWIAGKTDGHPETTDREWAAAVRRERYGKGGKFNVVVSFPNQIASLPHTCTIDVVSWDELVIINVWCQRQVCHTLSWFNYGNRQ